MTKPILTDRFENKGVDMAGFLPNPLKVEEMANVERREMVFGQELSIKRLPECKHRVSRLESRSK
ncbi:MAG: hypothetical protein V3R60_03195 [Acidobacteriota bacterium]